MLPISAVAQEYTYDDKVNKYVSHDGIELQEGVSNMLITTL